MIGRQGDEKRGNIHLSVFGKIRRRKSKMAGAPASGSGLFKFLRPSTRLQSTDIQAATMWGVAAATTALWLVQPFDWLKKTFFQKSESEEK
ncbi:hypothetical protein U1Q18_026361 [Sarracenia purpurea var. burkii]